MKVLLDTNVIVDVALEQHPFYSESMQVLSFVYQKQIEGYISASTFSDRYYIICKQKGRDSALDFLRRISSLCQIAMFDRTAINMALTVNFRDFEDAIPRILTPQQLIQELTNS